MSIERTFKLTVLLQDVAPSGTPRMLMAEQVSIYVQDVNLERAGDQKQQYLADLIRAALHSVNRPLQLTLEAANR